MRTFFTALMLLLIGAVTGANAQENMKTIATNLGDINVFVREFEGEKPPVIFLHGVYFDHHLWDYQVSRIQDRTVITVDMPLHGKSRKNIREGWTLNDCSEMLIEILDELKINKAVAVGHSWGSMTILRAAHKQPERFRAVALCNMPFEAATEKRKKQFKFQYKMLSFRKFYTKQAGKSLFGKQSVKKNPDLMDYLSLTMGMLSKGEVKAVDSAVIINADNATEMLKTLKVKAVSLKGREDYVPTPPKNIPLTLVDNGHVSPLESPEEVWKLIDGLISDEKN